MLYHMSYQGSLAGGLMLYRDKALYVHCIYILVLPVSGVHAYMYVYIIMVNACEVYIGTCIHNVHIHVCVCIVLC